MNKDLGNLVYSGSAIEIIITKAQEGFIVKCVHTPDTTEPNKNFCVTDRIENIYDIQAAIDEACEIINKKLVQ